MEKQIIFLLLVLIPSGIALGDEIDAWHTIKSTHFIIYYRTVEDKFLEELIDRSEDYYNKIADSLGFRRYNFWLWENRAKIYIYDDAKTYQAATGQPSWSSGCAIMKEKIIYTFPYARGFFETILPHEMGHIIFREFVGFDNSAIPFWLDEGVASYQEKPKRVTSDGIVKDAIQNDKFINLERLSSLNPQVIEDAELVNLFYAESLSLIDYLIKEYGQDNFVLFCQALRDKKDLAGALAYAYPFRNTQDLSRKWEIYLND